jgi:predicted AAA+ superfamily ATPase
MQGNMAGDQKEARQMLGSKDYKERVIDKQIERYLKIFGAVSVEGPKWCGKTWSILRHANSVTYLMDHGSRTLAELDPASALEGEKPHAIDEWQEIPAVWDTVRHSVDQTTAKGQYLLTGSVTPPEREIRHSGTGRIARIRMRTMSLYEAGMSTGEISLGGLLHGVKFRPGLSDLGFADLTQIACRGGWPGNLGVSEGDALVLPRSYAEGLSDIRTGTGKKRVKNTRNFGLLLSALARSNATTVSNATLHNEVLTASGTFSGDALSDYLQVLRDMFVLDEIPGWNPQIRSKARVLSKPKRMFTDPSLATAVLGATPGKYMDDVQAFGGIFEGMVLRDLLVYCLVHDARLFHYRDNGGLEVDAILELPEGTWAAFEIKLGERGAQAGASSLLRLARKMEMGGHRPPLCLAVITGTGIAQKREDGVCIVPVGMLRD